MRDYRFYFYHKQHPALRNWFETVCEIMVYNFLKKFSADTEILRLWNAMISKMHKMTYHPYMKRTWMQLFDCLTSRIFFRKVEEVPASGETVIKEIIPVYFSHKDYVFNLEVEHVFRDGQKVETRLLRNTWYGREYLSGFPPISNFKRELYQPN